MKSSERHLDAKTFQQPLNELANTIAYKVQREGPGLLPKPSFVIADVYYLLRQAHQTYNLFFFMNADERRQKDVDYRIAYSAVILPLVRTMIDCLYNITSILENPDLKGHQFRESGLKQILEALDADQERYSGDPEWNAWIASRRQQIDVDMRLHGLNESKVRAAKWWPTLSRYLSEPKKKTFPSRPISTSWRSSRLVFGRNIPAFRTQLSRDCCPSEISWRPRTYRMNFGR